jgi:hypothetical protein
MVNFFDRLYSSIVHKNSLLTKIRFYSCLRFLVRLAANVFLPLYFKLLQGNKYNCLGICTKTEGRIIVSLTSFPGRINRLWLVIETLLRQTKLPDKIILWLSEDQFGSFTALPKSLLRLQKNGLEIRIRPGNLGSHKKYYYAFQEFPEDIIITVDDDVFYNLKLIEYLEELYKKFPKCVCCNHCSEINISDNRIQPYISWNDYFLAETPGYKLLAIGMGGILYPPKTINPKLFDSGTIINCCYTADDIWLNVMSKLTKTMVVKSNYNSLYLPVMNYRNFTLAEKNVSEGLNDKQLASARKYCIEKLGIDPFQEITA